MMSQQQNDLITRVGPQTAAGDLLRMYWQPVALVDELEASRPLRPVKLMGQDFILFKDEKGQVGLMDRYCPHRGADLAYGRLEDGGVRCLFHGWLFDVNGKCLQTPAEPEGSRICQGIRQPVYPIEEKNGIYFAYIGKGDPPAFPDFDCFIADSSHTQVDPGPAADTPYQSDAAHLPQSLQEAVNLLHGSRFFRDALGNDFIDYYCHIKRAEIARFNAQVTDWEQREYFDVF